MVTNATVQPIKTNDVEPYSASRSQEPSARNMDLGQMTKVQLLDIAAEPGIKDVKSTMRKGELIELIEAAKGM